MFSDTLYTKAEPASKDVDQVLDETNKEKKEESCCVCYSSNSDGNLKTPPCNHYCCRNCLSQLKKEECPLCRADINDYLKQLFTVKYFRSQHIEFIDGGTLLLKDIRDKLISGEDEFGFTSVVYSRCLRFNRVIDVYNDKKYLYEILWTLPEEPTWKRTGSGNNVTAAYLDFKGIIINNPIFKDQHPDDDDDDELQESSGAHPRVQVQEEYIMDLEGR